MKKLLKKLHKERLSFVLIYHPGGSCQVMFDRGVIDTWLEEKGYEFYASYISSLQTVVYL